LRLDDTVELVIYKIVVPARWAGHNLDELVPMNQVKTLNWMRNGGDLPSEEPHFLVAGDQIYLRADADVIETMRNRLDSRQEQKP
jgi:hypothetical protein